MALGAGQDERPRPALARGDHRRMQVVEPLEIESVAPVRPVDREGRDAVGELEVDWHASTVPSGALDLRTGTGS